MIIKLTVKNSSVDFSGQEIDLNRAGFYLVTGPNGAGKTTILKHIVFTPRFKEPNRSYFAYAEQDPEKYDIRIADYLHRFQPDPDSALQERLLKQFDLTHLDLRGKISSVSGGELVKLNLIACLIRKTPFVFMDEPTNNLDDVSVEALADAIRAAAKDRVIVVVSHDPRLAKLKHHTINVETNHVSVQYSAQDTEHAPAADLKPVPCRYPAGKLMRRHLIRPTTILSVVLLLCYAAAFLLFNHITFKSRYNAETPVKKDGSLLVYCVDDEFGDLSRTYADGHSIRIREDQYYSMIRYPDIEKIAETYHPDDIFIEDTVFTDQLYDKLQNQTALTDPPVIMFPQTIQENYCYQVDSLFSQDYLIAGRYPRDGQKELVVSQAIIAQNIPDAELNDTVVLNGEEYTLVGIHVLDALIISYNGEDNYFYHYDKDTYSDFVSRQTAHKTEIEAPENNIYTPANIVMQFKPEQEAGILKQVFSEYPANNYRSHSYDVDMAEFMNGALIRRCLLVNAGCGILIGLLLILINRKRRMLYRTEAESFDNYYLTKPLTFRLLGAAELGICVLVLAAFAAAGLFVTDYKAEFWTAALGFTILTALNALPHLLTALKRYD